MDNGADRFSLGFARRGRSVTVAVHGEVDGSSIAILRGLLLDVVEGQGNLSVDLDLSDMTFIDSAGLTMLLDMHRRALERGGSFVLHNPRPSTVKVFEMVGLSRILTIA
ncbi:MAG TPA: STAS domain-containing protein [Acidimicrobiales bacterium]|nr:STAS domain-containing protein [Acidimicrobiales bacterium]